jgi:PAS domain-containing protein
MGYAPVDVETAEGLQKKLVHLDPMTSRKWRPGEILHIGEVTSRDELERNRFYQELMRPYNIEHVMAMHCVEPLGWSCLLGLMNGPDRRDFDGRDKALFSRLRPHLERSLRIYARMAMDRSEKDVFEDAVTRLAVGVIMLDLHGRVLHINPVAQAIAGRSAEMTLTNDRISLGHHKLNAELRQAIAAAAGIAPGQEDSFAKALRVEDENGDLMSLMVRSVPASGEFQAETSPRVVIYLSDPSHRYLTPEHLIAQLFELTPAEAACPHHGQRRHDRRSRQAVQPYRKHRTQLSQAHLCQDRGTTTGASRSPDPAERRSSRLEESHNFPTGAWHNCAKLASIAHAGTGQVPYRGIGRPRFSLNRMATVRQERR